VLEKTQTRALPLLNRAVEVAPAVNACCGVCRSCVTTNVLTLAGAGIVAAAAAMSRFAGRILRRSDVRA
jgi:hypothetical protein